MLCGLRVGRAARQAALFLFSYTYRKEPAARAARSTCACADPGSGGPCDPPCGACETCQEGSCVPLTCPEGQTCDPATGQCQDPSGGTCGGMTCDDPERPVLNLATCKCDPACLGETICWDANDEGYCCAPCSVCPEQPPPESGACMAFECPPCQTCNPQTQVCEGGCGPCQKCDTGQCRPCGGCETCDEGGSCVPLSECPPRTARCVTPEGFCSPCRPSCKAAVGGGCPEGQTCVEGTCPDPDICVTVG
jgi:hypothetical protein